MTVAKMVSVRFWGKGHIFWEAGIPKYPVAVCLDDSAV